MKVDPRFLTGDGPEVFTGNEALLKGALETEGGVHLLGGYPGSPVAGFFDSFTVIKDLLNEKGIRAVINNNEALAAAALNGSQTLPCRAMIVMKSVGVHVAADALALGNLAGAHPEGGAIVVYGDDPWSDSTQVPADSRYISKHLFIPVIEPANIQEVKDFVDLSFKLSRRCELFAGFLLTTHLADGGGSATCRPNQYPAFNTRRRVTLETAAINLDKRVLLPPKTWWQEESFGERLPHAAAVARELGINRLEYPAEGRRPVGFATSGLAHGYLLQSLYEMGQLGQYPILKFGMSYPVDPELVRELAGQCERIIVVEERRGFLEEQISELILRDRQEGRESGSVQVWGKHFPEGLRPLPWTRGLHPSILIDRLAPLLKVVEGPGARITVPAAYEALDRELETIDSTAQSDIATMPPRLPTFCPGCPHRDSASLCLEIKKQFMDGPYMRRRHGRGPVDLLFHGDTGCYTMMMFPPTTPLMHDYSGMGLGAGTGSGIQPFITNKEVVFMGDSTFFHSGQIAISHAIKIGQDITFIILDNRTTAMTGHQPTPGVDYDILGNPTASQDIEDIVRGMAGGDDQAMRIVRADPEKRKLYGRLLEETFLADGVKVIIADKECGITRNRRLRRAEREFNRRLGYVPARQDMNINEEICRYCLSCAEMTGCPGLTHVETDYGPKMDTSLSSCVNDGACERVGACSSFERIVIKRKRAPRSRIPELGLDDIPEPQKRPAGKVWRCCLVGVGGMGAGVATKILVRAGHKEGYPVIFLDKKGLAIRNGGVISQVVYNISDQPITAIIPYGKANLLLGIDILEAARAIDPKGRTRVASGDTAAVVNTDKVLTIRGIMDQEDFDPGELERLIRSATRKEDYLARNISRICETYLGSKIYANIMMLGFAFQRGLIPVSMHSMAWAIKDTIRADFRKNLLAFNMGRKLVVQSDLFQGPPQRTGWRETLEEKCRHTIRRYRKGAALADGLRRLAADAVLATADLAESLKRDVVVRIYDCMRWGGLDYARRYADRVRATYERDSANDGYVATRAVIHNLAKAMLIKDGVYIAELATSPEKHARDRKKYNVHPSQGDRIVYRHQVHSAMHFGPWKLSYQLSVPHWAMRVLKRMKLLRALPGWHRRERRFLTAYERRVDAFAAAEHGEYVQAITALSSPQCMDCMNPRCREAGCPLATHIPQWLDLSDQQRWREALDKLHETNNFPEFTALICPAPCQGQCKQAASVYPVQVRDIERRIVERGFAEGWVTPCPPARATGRKVAIVGSGPAGLAAAQQLARAGHEVTVFEKDAEPGGLLRYGVPEFRLDKQLIDRRLDQLRAEGVTFRTGVTVGADVTGDSLRGQFDAVLLATGAQRPRDLDVPGRNQHGVHFALDFLRQQNLSPPGEAAAPDEPITVKDKVVVVIGGGETGNDCVEAALIQGAKEIHQIEILPEPDPAIRRHLAPRQHVNGAHRLWSVATKAFAADHGHITELQAVQVQWVESTHGHVMRERPGTAFRVKVDLALLALGFEPVVDPRLAEQLGLGTDSAGHVAVTGHATSVAGVFAAGDFAHGAQLVVNAIRSGRDAAAKIDEYLAK